MSSKLLWTGLTLYLAVPVFLKVLGLGGGDIFQVVGAVIMVIGMILLWMDK